LKLSQIEYFIALAKHLNFTAAAKSLFISQPSLSRHIGLLEKEIGTKLFYRNNRIVSLTPAGKQFYNEFEKFYSLFEKSIEKVIETGKGTEGSLSIGCLEGINFELFFPDIIRLFSENYHNITLNISQDGFRQIREGILNGTYDAIFTLSKDIDNIHELQILKIRERQGHIVFSQNSHLASKENFSLTDLQDEPFLVYSSKESPAFAASCRKLATENGFTKIKEVSNVETLLSHLELGMGFSVLDKSYAENRKNSFVYYKLPLDDDPPYSVCTWKKDNTNSSLPLFIKTVQAKIDELETEVV
jgi:DNA-binding transcriptional LysR family regulator